MNFCYPDKDIKDLVNFNSGNKAAGFYPVGVSNVWHGGIHIEGSGKEICAIADGKIVACRIPEKYVEEVIERDGKKEKIYYSNGCVVIQHKFKYKANDTNGTDKEFIFYSLYNHLLPYKNNMVSNDNKIFGGKDVPLFLRKQENGYRVTKGVTFRDNQRNAVEKIGKKGVLEVGTLLRKANITTDDKHWTKSEADLKYEFKPVIYESGSVSETGFVATKGFVEEAKIPTKEYDKDKFKFGKVINDSAGIAVKCGDVIGYSGNYGTKKKPTYFACHVEVFTLNETELNNFIEGKVKGEENMRNYFRFKKAGMNLLKKYPITINNSWEVKTIQKGTNYSKIEIIGKQREVNYSDLKDLGSTYSINGDKFDAINKQFDGVLSKDSILKYVSGYVKGKNNPKRIVLFSFNQKPNIFWIANGKIKPNDKNELLETAFADLYDIENDLNADNATKIEIAEDTILKGPLKEVKLANDIWYQLEIDKKKGWIKKGTDGLSRISPYKWAEWGFKVVKEDPNDFIFDGDEKNDYITKLCKEIDTEKVDDNISESEMNKAHKNRKIANKLAGVINYHLTDWAGEETANSFLEKLIKIMDEQIDKLPDFLKTNARIHKKERIEALKENIKTNGFWKEVNALKSNSKVFYFHPIAFVEQMGRMGVTNWHDPVLNPQINKYEFSGTVSPKSSCFGNTRSSGSRFHHGLDIFAVPKTTKVYACLDSKFISASGSTVTLEIINTRELITQKNLVNYTIQYPKDKEYLAGMKKPSVNNVPKGEEKEFILRETDTIQFRYIHLDSWVDEIKKMKVGEIVKAGSHIAYAGVKGGAEGTHAPHLHLEILNITAGTGFILNPALFINLHSFDNKEQDGANKSWT